VGTSVGRSLRRPTLVTLAVLFLACPTGIFANDRVPGPTRANVSPTAEAGPPGDPAARSEIALTDGRLRDTVERLSTGRAPGTDAVVEGERVLVEVLYTGEAAGARRQIEDAGGIVNGEAGTSLLQAMVPFRNLVSLEGATGIASIRLPVVANQPIGQPDTQAGSGGSASVVAGQELTKTNATAWLADGITGAGVKVGIIDFFDQSAWNAAQAAGELPLPAGTFCRINGSSCSIWASAEDHGEGVAEIIHEMAPDAQVYLATAYTASDLQAAVNYFATQDVQIVSRSSTAEYDGRGDGTGPIDQVVASAVAHGMAWFNAAGNSAGKTGVTQGSYWRGGWSDPDGDGWLNWSGSDELLGVGCGPGGRFINGLRWSDWGANRTDYDAYLFEDAGATILKAVSEDDQGAGADPIEHLSAPCTDTDYLAVHLYSPGGGTTGDVLEFQVNGAGLEYWQNPYSAAIPAADSASAGGAGDRRDRPAARHRDRQLQLAGPDQRRPGEARHQRSIVRRELHLRSRLFQRDQRGHARRGRGRCPGPERGPGDQPEPAEVVPADHGAGGPRHARHGQRLWRRRTGPSGAAGAALPAGRRVRAR
jgi:hypothetical protein